MSRKHRYEFTKKVHPGYIVFLVVKGKYVTYGNDIDIIRYIKFNGKFKVFDKYKINYLVLDNLDIIDKKEYDNNNYDKYLDVVMIRKIVKKIGNNLVITSLL
jgi:hypothetical protein